MLKNNLIIHIVSHFILPFMVVFGLYIQINGEDSPGGGFQAGALLASCIILFDQLYGVKKTLTQIKHNYMLIIASIGCLIYILTGMVSFFYNQNYLNYYSLSFLSNQAQKLGIFLVELGVLFTVTFTLTLIYFEFKRFYDFK